MKLNVKAFALTCGLVWGLGLMMLTWWIMLFEGATGDVTFLGRRLVWAFFDGAIGGAIFAWLYNLLAGRMTDKEQAQS